MDPRTGETFGPMPTGDAQAGDELTEEKLRKLIADPKAYAEHIGVDASRLEDHQAAQLEQLERAAEHVADGGRLVAVDAAAAQRARLGDRELRRRKQRRN